ncbi:receptor-binding cancer antigen expressed on SiSo cells-like isoform X2 [Lineus longissimus]|uniref:receptor-binding cancer antigen expressed on SiSo cells-like isoform X2 n=1 Tax=Lineus longissimus TaxID=88925 RepID=UPI002B4E9EBE
MSIVTVISRKFLGIVLGIMALFKRAMCFLGRKRRDSGTLLPTANHYPNPMSANVTQSVPGNEEKAVHVLMEGDSGGPPEVELESWDNWGQGDGTINISVVDNGMANNYQTGGPGHHGNQMNNTDAQEEPEIDFFQDMTPTFRKPKTILIRKKEEQAGTLSSRLAMSSGSDIPQQGPDLGSWEDTENAWDEALGEDLSWEAEAAIKEKRRQEREHRFLEHQKKKIERDSQRLHKKDSGGHISAVKLS